MTPAFRSLLSVPASEERFLARAASSGAGALMYDLEDGVAPDRKAEARERLGSFLAEGAGAAAAWVRVNSPGTPWWEADAAAVQTWPIAGVVLPKATLANLASASVALPVDLPLMLLVESALGIEESFALATEHRAVALLFGSEDYRADLGAAGSPSPEDLRWARARLANAAAASGCLAIDGPFTALEDDAGLARALAEARAFGYGAKLCIHPRQIQAAESAFRPTAEQTAWAKRVVDALDTQTGVAVVDGRMVDEATAAYARRLLG